MKRVWLLLKSSFKRLSKVLSISLNVDYLSLSSFNIFSDLSSLIRSHLFSISKHLNLDYEYSFPSLDKCPIFLSSLVALPLTVIFLLLKHVFSFTFGVEEPVENGYS